MSTRREALPLDPEALRAFVTEQQCETDARCEQLEAVPAQVRVIRQLRPKCACPHCRKGVHIAASPP
ncbi:MAG: hypothetical protein GY725_25960 [bacterium]|nr:hypothetical protein [bacterium]